jgi:hypothetical protein
MDSDTQTGRKERYYSIRELSAAWGLRVEIVRDLVRGRPGVIVKRRAGRGTVVPASVANEVYRERYQQDWNPNAPKGRRGRPRRNPGAQTAGM